MKCPIPDCGQEIGDSSTRQCACAQKIALVECPICKMVCPGYAKFCRACKADLTLRETSRVTGLTGPDFLSIPGTFKGRPRFASGFFWALTGFGDVYRLSTQAGAVAAPWARTPSPSAASSQFAVTDVRAAGSPFQGKVLVTANRSSIYAVSLVDRTVHEITAVRGSEEFLFGEDVSVFTRLAASADFISYLVRGRSGSKTTLCVQYFNPSRAVEQPFSTEGRRFIGPVIRSSAVAICTEEEIFLYDTSTSTTHVFTLPSGFEPYYSRPNQGPNVPPGHVPFEINKVGATWKAYLGGELHGQAVVLEAEMDKTHFSTYEVRGNSCICEGYGGLCLNAVSGVECFGVAAPSGRMAGLQPRMLVGYEPGVFGFFQKSNSPLKQDLIFIPRNAEPLSAALADPACNEDTCCGMQVAGDRFVIIYVQTSENKIGSQGLKFALWSAE